MSRNRRRTRRAREHEPIDAAKVLGGWHRVVVKRDGEWHAQPMSGERAVKPYTCPGCHREIAPGTPHLAVWRADGIFGAEDDLAGRRHWHRPCWELKR